VSSGALAVWNRAQAWVALGAGEDRLQLFRCFDAECDALGLTRDARDAAVECLRLRTKIEGGDGGAVLDAIGHCAEHQLVIPEWLADEYLRRHGAVGRGWAKDWNDERAFGRAYPKGTNIAGIRAKVEAAPAAYVFAAGLLAADPSRPFDEGFYEEVGKHIGVGKTRAQELLSMALKDARHSWPPLADLRTKLVAGLTKDEAFRELSNEQTSLRWDAWLEANGYAPAADGVWRKNDPGK
jgi:hypothetical protein